MVDETKITMDNRGVVFEGEDAVTYAMAKTLVDVLTCYVQTGLVPLELQGRITLTQCLHRAGQIAGKTYKANRTDARRAAEDVGRWADLLFLGIPLDDRRK